MKKNPKIVVMSPTVATKGYKQQEVFLATIPVVHGRGRTPNPWRRQHVLISDFLDLANLSIQEEAALATTWDDDRPEGLRLQNLALATTAGPVMSSSPQNLTADVQHAIGTCESLGPGQQLILHRNPSAIAATFSPHMAVLRRHFLPNMHFQCCMLLQGTLGGDFDIFAASGESTAWVLHWKTRSRPIGVRVCPVAQFNFFSTAFDPREWTMVVFWKEDSGRQPPLVTPENEGRDETSSPSPPKFTFFDDLDVPFRPRPRGPLINLVDLILIHKIRKITLDFHQDYLQLPHLSVEKEQERWINRVSDRVRDHHYQSHNLFTFQ